MVKANMNNRIEFNKRKNDRVLAYYSIALILCVCKIILTGIIIPCTLRLMNYDKKY